MTIEEWFKPLVQNGIRQPSKHQLWWSGKDAYIYITDYIFNDNHTLHFIKNKKETKIDFNLNDLRNYYFVKTIKQLFMELENE